MRLGFPKIPLRVGLERHGSGEFQRQNCCYRLKRGLNSHPDALSPQRDLGWSWHPKDGSSATDLSEARISSKIILLWIRSQPMWGKKINRNPAPVRIKKKPLCTLALSINCSTEHMGLPTEAPQPDYNILMAPTIFSRTRAVLKAAWWIWPL